MKTKYIIVVILLITLLGGFLRFYKMTENPPSLTGDEISFGYSAYSILKTGSDEKGRFLPLVLESIGDYKNPLPAYLMILPIKLFGLNEFSVRLQNVLIGTLMIPVLYLFIKDIFKDRRLAITGAFLLSISAWHIYFSRFAYEPLIASFFIMLGVWCSMKMWDGGKKWAFLMAFFLMLTMYTAFAPRLFIPVFVIGYLLLYLYKKGVKKQSISMVTTFVLSSILLGLPLVYVSLFAGATTRLGMVFLSKDIEFTRYVIFHDLQSFTEVPFLILFWLKRYLNYLQPEFLFTNGLNMTLPGTFGLGLLYVYELPFLILGIIYFLRTKIPYKPIFILWVLIGIIPDSLTNNQQHAGRLLHIVPVVILLVSFGLLKCIEWVKSLPKMPLKIAVTSLYTFFIFVTLIQAFLVFAVHFPRHRGESFDEGLKEAALYVRDNQDQYQEVVFDIRRGIDGPYLIAIPHMYLLFYSQYDPHTYQVEPKIIGSDRPLLHFNKYTFRNVDWTQDRTKKNTLFISSPWGIPDKDIPEGWLLKKVYLSNGLAAFNIVAPKD